MKKNREGGLLVAFLIIALMTAGWWLWVWKHPTRVCGVGSHPACEQVYQP